MKEIKNILFIMFKNYKSKNYCKFLIGKIIFIFEKSFTYPPSVNKKEKHGFSY